MLTTFKVKYLYAGSSEFVPQVHKGMPYRNPISFGQVMGFESSKRRPITLSEELGFLYGIPI